MYPVEGRLHEHPPKLLTTINAVTVTFNEYLPTLLNKITQ